MKKILFGLSMLFTTLISAQNYPDYYPSNSNSGYNGDYDDEYYFPDDYYYDYPSDYYTDSYYQSNYADYMRSINDINWKRFFRTYRLSPWQVQQIVMLNSMYPTFSAWDNYYRYNPDRWYYDRFYALERILGPRVFVVFTNNYYGGYNPVVWYQNYKRKYYATNIYIVSAYRNININRYKIDRVRFHKTNPRQNFGFTNPPRNSGNFNNTSGNGFNDSLNQAGNNGFRNRTTPKNHSTDRPRETNTGTRRGGFRTESNSGGQRNSGAGFRTATSERISAQRFTSR